DWRLSVGRTFRRFQPPPSSTRPHAAPWLLSSGHLRGFQLSFFMHDLIRDITYSIGAAWLLGLVAQFFRQPLLLAYLVGGFALGPAGFKLIESAEALSALSGLGLFFF